MTRSRVLAQLLMLLAASHPAVASARAQAGDTARTATLRRDTLESVVIRATRAPLAAGAAQHTVKRAELQRTSSGKDTPLALLGTPSMTAYSDAGGFSGYSYVRMRGIDQSRLNITMDGVPLNDPEDQVLYFSNFPDFLGSMSSAEIGRGVGASSFGTASFAGSLNFESMPLATTPRGGQAELSGGSFGTWRSSVQGATGVDSRGIAAYGRFSRQGTQGYRHHSGNDGWSGFGSAGWFGDRDALKVTAMSGLSGTRLAYYAARESDIAVDRRTNPVTDAEGDRFHQELVSAQYSRTITDGLQGTVLLYRNSAAGAYDVYFGDEPGNGRPLYGNFGLAHVWQGVTSAFTWTAPSWSLALGGSASDYHRDHWMAMRDALDERLYMNTGVKRDASAFLKGTWRRGAWSVSGDVHSRYARFRYDPSDSAGIHAQPVTWNFVNPKLGVVWDGGGRVWYYATAGRSWREPTRSDLLAGADDLNRENINDILPFSQVHPEKVDDYEAGVVWRHRRGSVTVNAFAMEFHNEIAPIGELSITGAQLHRNVPQSYRRGVEIDGTTTIRGGSALTGNVAVMNSRISEYNDKGVGVVYTDVEPVLSPPVTANLRWDTRIRGPLGLALSGRYVGEMHLANDGNDALVVPTMTMFDGSVQWERGTTTLRVAVNNVLNAGGYSAGYTDGVSRYLFPLATRSVLLTWRRAFGGFALPAAR
ncbi:MAG: TonB-dependent receptor [Gemmatimonadetes bacterium]|nr:TonB-dependent receptor [Gemmatimonadota bacterium]